MPHGLEVRGLAKSYGGVRAVDGVSFAAAAGRITGLVGPNGAGKTTVLNLLTGVDRPDAGELLLDGRPVETRQPHRIARLGIVRTFQSARVFPNLDVLDNVLVGADCGRQRDGATERARELLDVFGLGARARDRAADLSSGAQKILELARLLLARPKVILLDEPAAGLSEHETQRLADTLVAARDAGLTVLLVEHNLRLVMGVCERIVVLDAGKVIATGSPEQVQADAAVRQAYLGGQRVAG
ncbi:branched-chain amino acid transport system ATP-binding protein [Amycolatopsis sacchari]|uniref:Branched-chain amino acid transport system ATP-binding protein n=1 Tax=Amycolatopsis sacchari TaxID=115433 RepID=A0A1I3L3E1_9PSEU|nr:ABC transporter ATP-binding protein [Amycolatopsis sacchari]SFI79199.1 branched-chain amino acid transport system ATP-binding protein [Amycolatopsis sacchari]